jgi:hypothetical protein
MSEGYVNLPPTNYPPLIRMPRGTLFTQNAENAGRWF